MGNVVWGEGWGRAFVRHRENQPANVTRIYYKDKATPGWESEMDKLSSESSWEEKVSKPKE